MPILLQPPPRQEAEDAFKECERAQRLLTLAYVLAWVALAIVVTMAVVCAVVLVVLFVHGTEPLQRHLMLIIAFAALATTAPFINRLGERVTKTGQRRYKEGLDRLTACRDAWAKQADAQEAEVRRLQVLVDEAKRRLREAENDPS